MPANKRGGGGGRYYNNHGYQRNQNQQGNMKKEPVSQSPSKPVPAPVVAEVAVKPQPQNMPPPLHEAIDGPKPSTEKRFTQRSRLFVGNLPTDMSEQQFKDLFSKFGDISETFVNSAKGFGFVRLDTRANAERAKLDLDGFLIKNRPLRVRFASHGAALSLKHLSPYVSNELLETAFSQFGPVERAVVIVDDRGRATGRGIVEFARKSSATKALQQLSDGCFLLTSSPQACVVKPLEQEDTEDGLSEKNMPKSQQYFQEREAPPRFAQLGTFEYEFAMRWKALNEMEQQQQEQLDKSIAAARQKLESEMENAIHDHKTMLMKQDLLRRQEELNRLEDQRQRELERRKQLEFAREDAHKKELEALAQRQEILRAQVEGNYSQSGHDQGNRNQMPPRQGGFGHGPNAALQEAIALEMMAGGQGGLGPAPAARPHSTSSCPFSSSNMWKLIGKSAFTRKEEKFYQIPFFHRRIPKGKGCRRLGISDFSEFFGSHFYDLLPHCPQLNTCQALSQWKFQILTSKINRMFARKSLKSPELLLYFVPIGPFPEFIHRFKDQSSNRSLFQLLGEFIKSFFPGSTVQYLPEVDISEILPRSRNHEVTGKLQYLVSDILSFLQKKLPLDGFAIIGLTWHDMYPCENLNFILGQGSSQHSACISSFGRFDPNYVRGFKGQEEGVSPEEMKDITEIDGDVLWKLMKVLSHETCHVFGLSHCTVFQCLMNSSSSTQEALSQPLYLCPLCMSKVQHLQLSLRTSAKPTDITVQGHFSSILNFLKSVFTSEEISNQNIKDTISWLQDMIHYLED